MDDITQIKSEILKLRQQVKYLMTRNAGGGIPVKVVGMWDYVPFDNANNIPPEISTDPYWETDVWVVDVYLNGLGNQPTKRDLALRVPVTPDGDTPPKIPEDKLFFAAPAKNEVAGPNNYKIPYYITLSGTMTVPCKVVSKIDPDPNGGASAGYRYNVLLYPDGLNATEMEAICEQLDILQDETIPEDTWVLATQASDGKWYMQVPVWL